MAHTIQTMKKTRASDIIDCAIVGAGPAGIISSIQLKRCGFNVILFEKDQVGGLLKNANKIENYLGFINGFEAIVSIGNPEENIIGSNCGQYLSNFMEQ